MSAVYLLAGSEELLKEENLARIKSELLDKSSEAFNLNLFYAHSSPAEKILECASNAPFLSKKRLVVVRQIEKFSAADKRYILSYIKTPNKLTCLVLETSQDNLRDNFLEQVTRHARTIFCRPLKDSQIVSWIKSHLALKGKKIEARAVKLLSENLGNNLQAIASALDNIILYAGPRETIEFSDVEGLVGCDINTNVFELWTALAADDRDKSFLILDTLLKEGINASQILGALAHQLLFGRNRPDPVLRERCLLELEKAEEEIKTSRKSQRLALELLLVKLLGILNVA